MFQIDKQSRVPIYEQLVESIEKDILYGVMISEQKMLSVRDLSMLLSINPNTIQKAYTILESKGITYSVSGVGRFINGKAMEILKGETKKHEEFFKNSINKLKLMGVSKKRLEEILNKIYEGSGL